MAMAYPEFTPEEQELLLHGETIKALKKYRDRTGLGLGDIKRAADQFLQDPAAESVVCPRCKGTGRVRGAGMAGRQASSWVARNCKFAQAWSGDEDDEGGFSTESEMDQDDARVKGSHRPGQAWILSDRDVWYRNPYYKGPPQPHPEDYHEHMEPEPAPKPQKPAAPPDAGDPKVPF
jgi:hypothetical protein